MSFLHLKLHFDQFGIIDQILCGAIFFVEHLESNTKVPVEKCSFLDIKVVKKTTPLAIIHLTKSSEKSVEGFFFKVIIGALVGRVLKPAFKLSNWISCSLCRFLLTIEFFNNGCLKSNFFLFFPLQPCSSFGFFLLV